MEEKKLIRLSQDGNEQAFASLVNEYKAKVFNLALSFTRDRAAADDLAQEVFIKAYFALPGFKFKSEFGTWLYRIAVNHIKDYLRRKKTKNKEISLDSAKETSLVAEGEREMYEREKVEEERRQLVHHVLRSLPSKYRIIITLRDIQGLSYEEISRILKISTGTVDSRLHRARKILRKKIAPFLAQKGGDYELQAS